MAGWSPSPALNTERSMGCRARNPNDLSIRSANSQQATCPHISSREPGAASPQTLFRWLQAGWPSALPPPTSALLWAENKQNRRD